jgi:predicted peptidase
MLRIDQPMITAENDPSFPACILAPCCPAESNWIIQYEALADLIDAVFNDLGIDRSRVYCTGSSMGGAGAWYLAAKRPDLFTAVAPSSGYWPVKAAPLSLLDGIHDTAFWVSHGRDDKEIPLEQGLEPAKYLERRGIEVRYTITVGGHRDGYLASRRSTSPDLLEWLFSHERAGAAE